MLSFKFKPQHFALEQFIMLILEFPKATRLKDLEPDIDKESFLLGILDFDDYICLFLFLFNNLL